MCRTRAYSAVLTNAANGYAIRYSLLKGTIVYLGAGFALISICIPPMFSRIFVSASLFFSEI